MRRGSQEAALRGAQLEGLPRLPGEPVRASRPRAPASSASYWSGGRRTGSPIAENFPDILAHLALDRGKSSTPADVIEVRLSFMLQVFQAEILARKRRLDFVDALCWRGLIIKSLFHLHPIFIDRLEANGSLNRTFLRPHPRGIGRMLVDARLELVGSWQACVITRKITHARFYAHQRAMKGSMAKHQMTGMTPPGEQASPFVFRARLCAGARFDAT